LHQSRNAAGKIRTPFSVKVRLRVSKATKKRHSHGNGGTSFWSCDGGNRPVPFAPAALTGPTLPLRSVPADCSLSLQRRERGSAPAATPVGGGRAGESGVEIAHEEPCQGRRHRGRGGR